MFREWRDRGSGSESMIGYGICFDARPTGNDLVDTLELLLAKSSLRIRPTGETRCQNGPMGLQLQERNRV